MNQILKGKTNDTINNGYDSLPRTNESGGNLTNQQCIKIKAITNDRRNTNTANEASQKQ